MNIVISLNIFTLRFLKYWIVFEYIITSSSFSQHKTKQ